MDLHTVQWLLGVAFAVIACLALTLARVVWPRVDSKNSVTLQEFEKYKEERAAHCAKCGEGTNQRLSRGDDVLLWIEAVLRLLIKKEGITPREIDDEIRLLRAGRREI